MHYLDNEVFDITDARCNHEETISILSVLLREQWLSDGSLPGIKAVDFKFPVNISIFLLCAVKSIDFCVLFSLNTS